MMRRNILSSRHAEELRKHRRNTRRGKLLIFLLIIVLAFIGFGFLSRVDKLNIQNFKTSGNKVLEAAAIESFVKSKMDGRYLFLYPKTNFLFYPKGQIKEGLGREFAILKDIDLNLEDSSTLKVSVTEREPKYMWCGENLEGQDCYFMDEDGYIFGKAPYFSGDVYFKFFGELPGGTPLGSYYALDNFQNLINFKNSLEKMDIKSSALLLNKDEDVEVYLENSKSLSARPKIIFKLKSDFGKVLENLDTAVSSDPLAEDMKNNFSTLQYIDLRFGNKIYYK